MAPSPSKTVRKEPKQERARATVKALIDATARVLVDEGYDHATTNRIAEVAGVSIGSLYQYFPNREALVAALLDRHESEVLDLLSSHLTELESASLEDVVKNYVRAMIATNARSPRLHRALMATCDVSELRPLHARTEALVRGYLERHAGALRPARLDQAAFILMTAVEAVVQRAVLHRPEHLDDPSFADEIGQLVLGYLVGEPR